MSDKIYLAGGMTRNFKQGMVGSTPNSRNKETPRKSYKCLDCPQVIHRGKRCRVCAEKERNRYNMAEPSEIMRKVYKI